MATNKNVEFNKNYWDAFYKSNHRHTPSQFCVCVLTEIEDDAIIIELGSGNGRDAHYFASQGHHTIAMDLSDQAIKSCKDLAVTRNIKHSTFFQGDITNKESVKNTVQYARDKSNGQDVIYYSRFVMHSIDDSQESAFLKIISDCMKPGEVVYFEFRSKEDAELTKHYGGHFRRYVDTEKFKQLLTEEFDLEIDYLITGQGMAKFKEEDPYVSRITARKI